MGNDRVCTYTNVSTDTTIITEPGLYYGCSIVPKSTAAVVVHVYDASATATGVLIYGATSASTAGLKSFLLPVPVQLRTGLHVDITCTSGADQVIVYYGK